MTSDNNFEADLDQIYAVQKMIDGVADRMDAGLADLTKKMTPLLGGWEGATAKIYQQEWDEWHEGATEVAEALRQCIGALGMAAPDPQSADDNNCATFRSTGSVLDLGNNA